MGMATKVGILGNAISLRQNPLRIAEELAMLDVISGGRMISGFVRGIGAEYHSFGVNPAESRDRFREAHDVIVQAWTQPGPFAFEGEFFNYRYVNTWPRPLQSPHPEIWAPSTGSGETVVWAAERGYTYVQVFSPLPSVVKIFDEYRERLGEVRDPEPVQPAGLGPGGLRRRQRRAGRRRVLAQRRPVLQQPVPQPDAPAVPAELHGGKDPGAGAVAARGPGQEDRLRTP